MSKIKLLSYALSLVGSAVTTAYS
ncbi:MAG: hypothetical protein QOH39_1684, partial [Verrucomicrobiota bacterium]